MKEIINKNFLYSLGSVFITALICSIFNRYGMENFYSDINLSELTPPNIVFPIVWIILYVLLIFSYNRILNQSKKKNITLANLYFCGGLITQIVWSWMFFYNAWFLAAYAIIIVMLAMAIGTFYYFLKLDKFAGYMIIPYVVWVLFATYLNFAVIRLNGADWIING